MSGKFTWLTGDKRIWILYLFAALACWLLKITGHNQNNFLIFRASYYHLVHHLNLYAAYPAEHDDMFYYGPLFPVFFAPFALLPKAIGLLLWELANAAAYLIAVNYLPLNINRKKMLLLFCVIEFANSAFSEQFNPMMVAFIMGAFILVEKEKYLWATLLIVAGAMMKLYPIVGLAFFMFSRHKLKFLASTVAWTAVLLVLPVLFCGADFLIDAYHRWLPAVAHKNILNHRLESRSQDICIMGIVRDFTRNPNISDLPFYIFGMVVFAVPMLRFSQYKSLQFRMQVLAALLIMVVIFSSGGESPTYILPVTGVFLWLLMKARPFTAARIVLIIFLLILTGLGLSDVMPRPVRHDYIGMYGMKAWPCIIAWLIISWELWFKKFDIASPDNGNSNNAIFAAV
ncbi:glycosyltransferase family 87 protein [Mucilaginibacter sp. L3T2-6]|uniref:glycosyltransferase family 87 protein n=1 Tax=Mucilaginibacter sp. L3T2-6 TaxID=3062491 RepID=UPI002676CE9F|nr:glycosyltransferase family 87 protein [Mucilaginibacter sp. L3T2-6]MDO3642039.1 glycosyltransferase family 87 protein [Mucilaginibacter sp. L3T2-6]MDV6214283.1 glycosyltransferase family 87 protein [Mucilaginibacter sp. L3T2-6]